MIELEFWSLDSKSAIAAMEATLVARHSVHLCLETMVILNHIL